MHFLPDFNLMRFSITKLVLEMAATIEYDKSIFSILTESIDIESMEGT